MKTTGLNFGQVMDLLRKGCYCARERWNGKHPERGKFIYYVPGSTFEVNRPPLLGIYKAGKIVDYKPHIDIQTVDVDSGRVQCMPWHASQEDLLAEDWELIDTPYDEEAIKD